MWGAKSRAEERAQDISSRAHAEVAVTSSKDGILIVDADSGRWRPVPTAVRPALFDRVSWSPDGEAIAFAGRVGGDAGREDTDIFVVRADGSALRRLTHSGRASFPLWSPDASTLVFTQREPGPRFEAPATLWEIDAVGGEPRRLLPSEPGRFDIAGSFSPDGEPLALTRMARRTPENEQLPASIHVLELAGSALTELAERAAFPAFSRSGERIAYVTDVDENGALSYGDRTSFANELYVMDADGSDRQRLTRTRDLNERSPSWSADGGVIAYSRGKQFDNAEGYVVMAIAADGTCPRFVAADPGLGAWYMSPAWRPGGTAPARCAAARHDIGIIRHAFRDELRRARCELNRERSGCNGGVQVQLWPACARLPSDVDYGFSGSTRVRGVTGVFFESGHRLELVTGRTTVVIFAGGRASALAAARARSAVSTSVWA